MDSEWFTLDDIQPTDADDKLYCISVDSEDKQFLIGKTGVPTHNSEEGKEEDKLKGEASMIIGSIARLGRAAGVHLVIATQRPDANILPGETKANLGVRINCGRTDSNASSMILGTGDGTRVKANPRGRLYLRIYGNGDHGQGFFASPDWIDEYLASKGLNPNGTPISQRQSRLADLSGVSSLDSDLDTQQGVDNSRIIDQIREEESHLDDDDWGFIDDEDETQGGSPSEQMLFEEEEDGTEVPHDPNDKLGRPELGGAKDNSDKLRRVEDDWDADLDDLINEQWDE